MRLSKNEINKLKSILSSEVDTESEILNINNPLLLHNLILNYNWDDGWDLPNAIINNPNTDVSTVLVSIELASDSQYIYKDIAKLNERNSYNEIFIFCDNAFNKVKTGFFKQHLFKFTPSLSKVELFKLKKYYPDIYKDNLLLVEESGELEVKEYYI